MGTKMAISNLPKALHGQSNSAKELTSIPSNVPEVSNQEISRLIEWRKAPVREMPAEMFKQAAGAAIRYVATGYTGANDSTPEMVYIECTALLRQKFGSLAPEEVKEAFRLAAANRIDVNMTAYRGVFTVAMFGDVLDAYMKRRNKIIAAIETAKAEAEAEEEYKRKRFEWNRQADLAYDAFLLQRKENTQYRSWKDIPAGFDMVCVHRGAFDDVTETQKRAIYAQAKAAALEQVKYAAQNIEYPIEREEAQRILREVEAGGYPETLIQKSHVIYGKMLVFSLLPEFNTIRQSETTNDEKRV